MIILQQPKFQVGERVGVEPLEVLKYTPWYVEEMGVYAGGEFEVTHVSQHADGMFYQLDCDRAWVFHETALRPAMQLPEVSIGELIEMLKGGIGNG